MRLGCGAAVAFLAGCVLAPEAPITVIGDPRSVPGLHERVAAMLGDDFVLDRYDFSNGDLAAGYRHLAMRSRSEPVRKTLASWKSVYATSLSVQKDGEGWNVVLYGDRPDFSDGLVYAYSPAQTSFWGVYVRLSGRSK